MMTYQGVWPALVTPFTGDNRVNPAMIAKLVERFLSLKMGGFYVCGSTGQGLFMTVEERKLVAETVINKVAGRAPVVVHIGSCVVEDAVELARHAQAAGATGISSVIPAYFEDEAAIFSYYQKLAAAAPDLSLWPYLWSQTNDRIRYTRLLMTIPNVTGVKYTGSNMYELRQIVELRQENWTVFSGMDEQSIFASLLGVSGVIGSTMNIFPELYQKARACALSGDIAAAVKLQNAANQIIALMYRYGFRGALAEILRIEGYDCGEPRLPGRPFPVDRREMFRTELIELDFKQLAAQ